MNIGAEGAELENGNGSEYTNFLERNQLFAVNTYGDNKQSGPPYYGETSTRPDTIAIGLEYFGRNHHTRCTGKKRKTYKTLTKTKLITYLSA